LSKIILQLIIHTYCYHLLIAEAATIPLAKLKDDPNKQREAWQRAVETGPDGKVTAAHVYKIVKGMTNQNGVSLKKEGEDPIAVYQLKKR
jgi:hypothetical protein